MELVFTYAMTYEDFKDLSNRTVSDKMLLDKACNIVKNPKYEEIYIF